MPLRWERFCRLSRGTRLSWFNICGLALSKWEPELWVVSLFAVFVPLQYFLGDLITVGEIPDLRIQIIGLITAQDRLERVLNNM